MVHHGSRILFLVLISAVVTVCAAESDRHYFAVLLDGKKIGHAEHSRVVVDGEVRTTELMHMTISRMGIPIRMEVSDTSIETVEGRPLGFELEQKLSLITTRQSGRIGADGMLEVTTKGIGPEQKKRVPWPEGALMSEGLLLEAVQKGLTPGTSYTTKIFDPSAMRAMHTTVEVGSKRAIDLFGRSVRLTEVKSTVVLPGAGAVVTTSYVDDQLATLKSVIPLMGMEIEIISCSRSYALADFEAGELMAQLLLPSPVQLEEVGDLEAIAYRLVPTADGAQLNIPTTSNQTVRADDGNVLVTVRPLSGKLGNAFPYRGDNEAALKALESNVYLQCDDDRIKSLAREAAGQTEDAWIAAQRIERFVAGYIVSKDLTVGYASALETLESRQGDCTEHALLCTALCRSLGIPAEVVVGIAYVKEFAGSSNSFGGHAWTRVFIEDQWIGLDAAFAGTGRGGYDAGHLALSTGGGEPADFFSLIGTLGRFEVAEVVPLYESSDQ